LDVLGLLDFAGGRLDALDELVAVVHVEDQDAGTAELGQVANARTDHVEIMALGRLGRGGSTWAEQHQEQSEQRREVLNGDLRSVWSGGCERRAFPRQSSRPRPRQSRSLS